MDRNIKIEIKDRVAHLVGTPKIICGNNDYSVTFTFDDEWTGVDVKTLRVSYNNKYSDHVFSGDTVELPPIIKAVEVYLGVFAGDITSTKVAVRAEPSILCAGGSVADPEPDVYDQIIDLINAGMLKGDPGEPGPAGKDGEKGEKGDPGKDAVAEVTREEFDRLNEEIVEQNKAIEGKQPKGDYALKSEIPVEGVQELLFTIETTGEAQIVLDELNGEPLALTYVHVSINATNSEVARFEIKCRGITDTNMISATVSTSDSSKYTAVEFYPQKGWWTYTRFASGSAHSTGAVYAAGEENRHKYEAKNHPVVRKLILDNLNKTAGTIIKIWGVRA